MRNIFSLALICLCHTAMGQGALFQDAKGESAFKLFGNSITASTSAQSIDLAAGKYKRVSTTSNKDVDVMHRWAITTELKASEGISNLKNDDQYLVDGNVGLYLGNKRASKPTTKGGAIKSEQTSEDSSETNAFASERFVAGSVGADRNKLFNTALPPKDMVYSKGQFVYKIEAGQFGYTGNLLYGITASFKQQTNVDDIKVKTVSFLDYQSANDSIAVFKQKQAYDIKDFVKDEHVFSLNADGALLLNRKKVTGKASATPVFLALHFRYQYLENENGRFNPAIGFYLGKRGAPRHIVGGFNVQFLDVLNAKNDKTNAWDRATVNFVVGFKLPD